MMVSISKTQLIEEMAVEAKSTQKFSTEQLNAFCAVVTRHLQKGDQVRIIGFGNFEIRKRNARMGRNPQDGSTIKISARNFPVFRAGKSLKDAVK